MDSINIDTIIEAVDDESPFPFLPDRIVGCARSGVFSDDQLQEAFTALLGIYGEELADDIEGLVDDFIDEAAPKTYYSPPTGSNRRTQATAHAPSHSFRSQHSGSRPGEKGYAKSTLKSAARSAVNQIYKNPGQAKKIVKHVAGVASGMLAQHGREVAKGALRKGMKMVFGKWLKTESVRP